MILFWLFLLFLLCCQTCNLCILFLNVPKKCSFKILTNFHKIFTMPNNYSISILNYLYKTFARTFVMIINFVFICLPKSSLFTDIVIPFWLPKRGCLFYKLSLSQKSDALPQPKMILVNAKRCFREFKRILHAQIRRSLIYVGNNEKDK